MDNSFVRKSWYISPPVNANKEEWDQWVKDDDRAATIDKRRFSRERNRNIDVEFVPSMSVAKINGRYKQVVSIGFVGSAEDGTTQMEPIFEARQEIEVEQAKHKLVAKSFRSHGKGNHQNKRQAIRDARKAKYRSR